MEVQEPPAAVVKSPALTPKALIHEKYGSKACYTIEQVQQSLDCGCPGLVTPQKSCTVYKCCLVLPDLSVTSDTFTRKKDAEQSAAKLALEKLGIQSTSNDPTPQEAWNDLVARFSILFSDEFLSSPHPLVGHFRISVERVGELYGMIPLSAIAACDVKVNNLCKIIDPKSESDPLLVSSSIWKAARKSSSVSTTAAGRCWMRKHGRYSPEALELLMKRTSGLVDNGWIKALRIPYSAERHIESLSLDVSGNRYYLDEIAQKLDARDASQLLVSRTVGKASSEMKLYFSVPEAALVSSDLSTYVLSNTDVNASLEPLLNKRASYLAGQDIHGDAILANVGYTWKSPELFYEDILLCTYYRMLLGKVPNGHYTISREAILAAELPTAFTTRSNWKGPLPKELLCVFCRQHRLKEPLFSLKTIDTSESLKSESCKKMKLPQLVGESPTTNEHLLAATDRDLDKMSTVKCEVKLMSRGQDIILECLSDDACKKESDAIQNVALKVLTWFNKYFMQLNMSIDELVSFGLAHNIVIYPLIFFREFAMLIPIYGVRENYCFRKCTSPGSNKPDLKQENGVILVNVEGDDSGVFPSPGSLASISYTVTLSGGEYMKQVVESNDEFEFELGIGAVINHLEACVTQLSVNQAAKFVTAVPMPDLLLAAAGEYSEKLAKLPLSDCFLEFHIKVLSVTEPLEDRMEQALFSPPLSKQRVEFAVKHINDTHSTSLVDFGCGSGSLLDSLLEHSTTLERIVGVDISRKALTRAAKIIHSKLSKNSSLQDCIRSAVLYDGSITDFDSRLYRFDIGTCLEVIEHVEEDQACLFGDVVLSSFCPRVLIVSTPNYEYNPILQRSALPNKDKDPEEKPAACRFRNLDHKFEWTRQQFEQWATDLAVRHNYSVEFSGVGGNGDVEPGFASQIAVFRSRSHPADEKRSGNEASSHPYEVIWEWNGSSTVVV